MSKKLAPFVYKTIKTLFTDPEVRLYIQQYSGGGGGGGGAISSVFGRTGDVQAQSGDYGEFYYPLSANPSGFLTSVPAQSFASLTGKPTTILGYGITDAYPLGSNPAGYTTVGTARTSISVTNTGGGLATYNNTTGVFNIPAYAPLASPAFTGTPSAPTATAGNSTTALATTAFVTTADNLKANISSPTFTGVPAAPTAVGGTNTTQIATTAFVTGELSSYTPTSRNISTGTGLSGGGNLTADRTISLANTAVTPGSYTNPTITVDAQGRIITASNGSASFSPSGTPTDTYTLYSDGGTPTWTYNVQVHSGNDAVSLSGGRTGTIGVQSLVSGSACQATAQYTIAMGQYSVASYMNAVCMGQDGSSNGFCSVSLGKATVANAYGQTAVGHYNVNITANSVNTKSNDDIAFVVGIGKSTTAADGFRVYNSGSSKMGNITTTTVVEPSAILELESVSKGFLLPRMDSAQIDSIASPATGLQLFNTSSGNIEIYNGANWAGRLISSAAATLTLFHGVDYIFTGTTSTFTLPAVVTTRIGRMNMITIKNRGSGNITLNSNTGSTIYASAATNTITIAAGNAVTLMPDGTYFNVE